jgi:REP element-mobilizing transposase RayT
MELPKRKSNRLNGYDYSKNGAYFVTICTNNREILFGDVGAEIVQSFKRYSTIEYIKMVKQGLLPPFEKHIWQRSFTTILFAMTRTIKKYGNTLIQTR